LHPERVKDSSESATFGGGPVWGTKSPHIEEKQRNLCETKSWSTGKKCRRTRVDKIRKKQDKTHCQWIVGKGLGLNLVAKRGVSNHEKKKIRWTTSRYTQFANLRKQDVGTKTGVRKKKKHLTRKNKGGGGEHTHESS